MALFKLVGWLKEMRNDLMQQEVVFWYQKSRVTWLICGGKNTNFFHTSMIIRRRCNKIEGLLNKDHQWEYNQLALHDMAINFYKYLYRSAQKPQDELVWAFFSRIGQDEMGILEAEYISEETHATLAGMNPMKPPG